MKKHRLQFWCKMTVVGLLGTIGLVAISGEPIDEARWNAIFFGIQLPLCAANWLMAFVLYHHWDLGRRMSLLEAMERRQRLAQQQSEDSTPVAELGC